MLISNVKQWEGDQDNGGVGDVVCIAGMVADNVGMHCIKVFIHGHMVLNMCQSNCKTDLAKGTNYNMKNQCGPMISNYR
jgi:hypothetical protein